MKNEQWKEMKEIDWSNVQICNQTRMNHKCNIKNIETWKAIAWMHYLTIDDIYIEI